MILNAQTTNELLKDGENELKSLPKAKKVDRKKLLSASAKINTSLNRCDELLSEKHQLSQKRRKLSESNW